MKVITILTFLLLCQVGPPSQTPPSKKATNTAEHTAQPDKQNPNPTVPPPPISEKQTAPDTSKQYGRAIEDGESERAVLIVSLPPRSAGDTVALVCTIILTGAGIGGIVVAICTLRIIAQQTKATVISAKATQRSARATQLSAEATQASIELQKTLKRQWSLIWMTGLLQEKSFALKNARLLPSAFKS